MEKSVSILGIVLPSDSPLFLVSVGIHILLGLVCVLSATILLVQKKGSRLHVTLGNIYYYGIIGVFFTSLALAILRWPFDNHLLGLGTAAFALSLLGRMARRKKWRNWARWHAIGMSGSFIVLLTAFYVDNGKNLPVWKLLPEIYYWVMPAGIGLPLLVYSLLRNPYTRSKR